MRTPVSKCPVSKDAVWSSAWTLADRVRNVELVDLPGIYRTQIVKQWQRHYAHVDSDGTARFWGIYLGPVINEL